MQLHHGERSACLQKKEVREVEGEQVEAPPHRSKRVKVKVWAGPGFDQFGQIGTNTWREVPCCGEEWATCSQHFVWM